MVSPICMPESSNALLTLDFRNSTVSHVMTKTVSVQAFSQLQKFSSLACHPINNNYWSKKNRFVCCDRYYSKGRAPLFCEQFWSYILQGADHCASCRTYFLRTLLNGTLGRLCVESCPIGTYLEAGRSECVPCHEHCSREVGCAGPLPYLDVQNGCLDCSLVQLNQTGEQVRMCIIV